MWLDVLVEDSNFVRDLLSGMPSDDHAVVEGAGDGAGRVEHSGEHDPKVALVDTAGPTDDGATVTGVAELSEESRAFAPTTEVHG